MKAMKNNSGFTLLEIIIVIIIVGVLASLALPRLFSTVEYSRSTEALSAIASVRSSMERCYFSQRDFTACDDFTLLDVDDPAGSPGSHFTYDVTATFPGVYSVTATRNTRAGGVAADWVRVVQDDANNNITRSGGGSYSSL